MKNMIFIDFQWLLGVLIRQERVLNLIKGIMMKGKGEKHGNEGFYGGKRRGNKVSFGRGEGGTWCLQQYFVLGIKWISR